MIIGAMNNPKKDICQEIVKFGEMGFDFVEIAIESPCATPKKIVQEKSKIIDALKSYNFGVLCHLPWYFSVAHPYENIQNAINQEFADALSAASILGARKATIHTEFLPQSVQEKEVKTAKTIDTIKKIEKAASEHGIMLLVENAWRSSFSIKEFKLLFSECSAGLTLDIGHAETLDGEGFENYARHFKKKIMHVHLHDNDRRSDLHLPLGAGRIDIPLRISELKSFYDGTITLEVHSLDQDYLKISREKLEILWYGEKKFKENKGYLFPEEKNKRV